MIIPSWPRWIEDLRRLLPIRAQFVFTGNIRDAFLTPIENGLAPMRFIDCLWEALRPMGYEFLLLHDRVDGLNIYPDEPARRESAAQALNLNALSQGPAEVSIARLPEHLRTAVVGASIRMAVILDYASRLTPQPQSLAPADLEFFTACEKLAQTAHPIVAGDGPPLYNPIFWLCHRDSDLPSWFPLDNETIHAIALPQPDLEERHKAAEVLAPAFAGHDTATPAQLAEFTKTFAELSQSMTLRALLDITQLARAQSLGLTEIADAVRCYKVGALENPWKRDLLRERIRNARDQINKRVKGQSQAAIKTVDILMRSVMGLTGAQASARGARPRGVLFFAGPTGVGKTELAKSITEILFGDERAYIRFDMSEFAAEQADARLLGAPPGYVGYDAGGELTNAVRERPFSVILFDEIEKAHPRILDKFLQILEDGRLTDGRGNTVYFSEAVIIFTSNLGIFVEGPDGQRIPNVTAGEPYADVESKIRRAIRDHFHYILNRPEILNRIGDNIVVFQFIAPDIAGQIFEGMLNNVRQRVIDEHDGLTLIIPPDLQERLRDWCTADLSNGGRGIGNRLETTFVNPLARALFDLDLTHRRTVEIRDLREQDQVYSIDLA